MSLYKFFSTLLFSGLIGYAQADCNRIHTLPERYAGIHVNYGAASLRWPGEKDTSIPRHARALRLWDSYGTTWRDLEPTKGVWNFVYLDHYLKLAGAADADVLLTLGMTPQWASSAPDQKASHGPGSAAPPNNLDDWENYVRTLARRYRGKIAFYELWNEPAFSDLEKVVSATQQAGFFSGSSSDMVAMAARAKRAIREEDPNARIISPSMAGHYQGVKRLEKFLKNGGADQFDILGFHYYQTDTDSPELLPKLIKRVEDMAKVFNFTGPIWNTEMGLVIQAPGRIVKALEPGTAGVLGRVFSADESAAFIARYLLIGAACGFERFYWLSWDNGSMGLSSMEEGRIRVAHKGGVTFSNMAMWLAGAELGPCTQNSNVWICPMTSPALGKGRWIWWAKEGQSSIGRSSLAPFRRVVHLDGTISAPTGSSITLLPEPTFLVD